MPKRFYEGPVPPILRVAGVLIPRTLSFLAEALEGHVAFVPRENAPEGAPLTAKLFLVVFLNASSVVHVGVLALGL